MKIGFISARGGAAWGGSDYLWSQTAHRLLKSGHQVAVYIVKRPSGAPELEQLESAGATVQFERGSQFMKGIRYLQQRGVESAAKWEPLHRWAKRENPDLLVINNGGFADNIRVSRLIRSCGIPYVNEAQASTPNFWLDDSQAAVFREGFSGAMRCFFVSESCRRMAEDQLAMDLPNAEVIRNPFNVSWSACPAWPSSSGIYSLACVGRLEPMSKGQDLLFHVMAKPKWRERPVEVVLYGGGSCAEGVRLLARRLELTERVHFAGHVTGIEEVWSRHHALVLPSRYEGLPLALVEAMLCGRTAIVTDVSGMAEPLEDNVTGFVADAATVSALDEAMERAWGRRNEWQAMGRLASDSIRKQVPQDPAQVFADRLLQLASGK